MAYPLAAEIALLFSMTRQPVMEVMPVENGELPTFVYLCLLLYAFFGSPFLFCPLYSSGISIDRECKERDRYLRIIINLKKVELQGYLSNTFLF